MTELINSIEAPIAKLPDCYDLALRPMAEADLDIFTAIEDDFELPAELLLQRNETQLAADGLVTAANAYTDQGFFLKAGTLKRRAAKAYIKVGKLNYAAAELLDAVTLIRQADKFRKMMHETQNLNLRHDPIRASYPNLSFSWANKRGELDKPSSDLVFLEQMQLAYSSLLDTLESLGYRSMRAETYANGKSDLFSIHPEIYAEWSRDHRLFRALRSDWIGDINRPVIKK